MFIKYFQIELSNREILNVFFLSRVPLVSISNFKLSQIWNCWDIFEGKIFWYYWSCIVYNAPARSVRRATLLSMDASEIVQGLNIPPLTVHELMKELDSLSAKSGLRREFTRKMCVRPDLLGKTVYYFIVSFYSSLSGSYVGYNHYNIKLLIRKKYWRLILQQLVWKYRVKGVNIYLLLSLYIYVVVNLSKVLSGYC